jgi:hypothetical protein
MGERKTDDCLPVGHDWRNDVREWPDDRRCEHQQRAARRVAAGWTPDAAGCLAWQEMTEPRHQQGATDADAPG